MTLTARTNVINPTIREPLSPMKIRAGWKLKIRNPKSAPPRDADTIADPG